MRPEVLAARTVADFGDQWTRFRDNDGYYGSLELFADICGPLLAPDDVRGRRVADIGSGTGRIVGMLLAAGAAHVVAVEPSEACDVLRENVAPFGDRVECIRASGKHLPRERGFDLITAVGVLHHVPDPSPIVRSAWDALRPGGRFLVWLYGREGNRGYLAVLAPLRTLTTRLPHGPVWAVARMLNLLLTPYLWLARRWPVPLGGYLARVFGRMSYAKRQLIVYDQLKPAYAKYYRQEEAVALLADAGFSNVLAYHRHGYSWTIVGTRP